MADPDPGGRNAGRRSRAASLVYDVIKDFSHNRGTSLAAEVAFFAILSIFPFLLVVVSLLGFLGHRIAFEAQAEIREILTTVLSARAQPIIDSATSLFDRRSGGVLTIASVAAIYASSRSFLELIRALNLSYDVDDPRKYLTLRALAMVMALATIAVSVAVLLLLIVLPTVEERISLFGLEATINAARFPVALIVAFVWIMTIYHFAPCRRTSWTADVWGSVTCLILWFVFSIGFRFYITLSSGSNEVLTALGGGLVAILWLYLMSIAILIGAEVNAVVWRHGLAAPPPTDVPGRDTLLSRPLRTDMHGTGANHILPSYDEIKAKVIGRFRRRRR